MELIFYKDFNYEQQFTFNSLVGGGRGENRTSIHTGGGRRGRETPGFTPSAEPSRGLGDPDLS